MGIPTGARRYHKHNTAARRSAAIATAALLHAEDPRPVCPHCGCHFTPAADGQHYTIGRIPCNWRIQP